MAFEQKDNSGSLFVNDRKTQDNHPDRSGTIMVDGKLFWINGWLKRTAGGDPFLSLSVKPKTGQHAAPPPPPPRRPPPPSRNGYADRDDPDGNPF